MIVQTVNVSSSEIVIQTHFTLLKEWSTVDIITGSDKSLTAIHKVMILPHLKINLLNV
jgi:hypothetical protein